MFRYIEHVLYKLEKTKIAFEDHQPIDSKLCWPNFNYPRFYAISQFVQFIQDYDSAVNYIIAHSKVMHKYFFKVFYNKTNKKKYNLQIRQYNVRHTSIIAIRDVIISEKNRKRKKLLGGITDITISVEVVWASSLIDLTWIYKWTINNTNLDIAKELELTGIKKY